VLRPFTLSMASASYFSVLSRIVTTVPLLVQLIVPHSYSAYRHALSCKLLRACLLQPSYPADAFADEDLLVEFGSVASPQQAADIQARLEERRAAAAAASSSTSSSSSFIPRKLRKKQLPIEALPKVAIVGRPNVGKSAMFNKLAGSSLAVVFDYPGVTRDRLYTRAFWGDKEFCLIDTGRACAASIVQGYMYVDLFAWISGMHASHTLQQ
jgi:hypothetical protein